MSSLFNLTDSYLKVKRMEEEGADTETIIDTLNAIESAIEDKAENYHGFIKQLEGEIQAINTEQKRLADLKRSKVNLIDRLKHNLIAALEATGNERIQTDTVIVSLRNNAYMLDIQDESNIPMEFVEEVIERKIDKRALLQYVKENEVEGIHLKRSKGVMFR